MKLATKDVWLVTAVFGLPSTSDDEGATKRMGEGAEEKTHGADGNRSFDEGAG